MIDMDYIYDVQLIKKRIRELRLAKSWTQEQAAEYTGINLTNTWAKIENPNNTLTLSLKTLVNVVNGLDIDMNYLFRPEGAADKEIEHLETLIVSALKDLPKNDKEMIFSIISVVRQNRGI